jgi:NADH:ubiquinone reductase (H+-translocating)
MQAPGHTGSIAPQTNGKKRILILGGGFAGAYVAKHLEKRLGVTPDFEIFVISKENFVLFTPMLHEVAGSDVSASDIVQPLRKMLHSAHIGIAEIEAIDMVEKRVRIRHHDLAHSYDISYDQLVLALGAVTNFHHIPGLQEYAMTMKALGDAIGLRNRIIDALELADNLPDETARSTALTVVVAGGGFAGIETAGAVNDFLREGIKFYPRLTKRMVRVVVVDPMDHILPELEPSLGHYTREKLTKRGVEIRLNTKVTGYDSQEVTLENGDKIATRMLIWTAGITPAPALSNLPCELQHGRVVTDDCLRVPNWPGVWALGDCALVPDPLNPGKFYPPTAQHAIRQAAVLADNIAAALHGQPPRPFKFKMLGQLAAIGHHAGVAQILGMKFSGFFAWWLWRGIYLGKLPGFQKKVRVTIDWALDSIFPRELVQLPTLRAPTVPGHAEDVQEQLRKAA